MTPHSNHRHVFVNGAAACLLAVCSVACCPTSLRGQENGLAESGFGALLLKETDAVISGRITRRGTHYEVEIASQSRVSIPLQNVAYAGTSLEDLYQFKRQGVSRWSVGDHYQLTRWCLRYGLLAQAAEHYGEVAQRQPDHVRVKQLRVELETRLLAEPAFRQYLGLAPVAPAPAARESLSPLDTPATEAVTASSRALDVLTHPEVVRRFSERVQPILINRCSQAACHGVQSS
ncbi:MAG: hypothetical protein KDA45_00300, partial [Planctomycetales bacterium]|nr:hypothetical protein [Planctomycetales bacterium]